MIYEPREDSFLMEKAVKKYACGKVLDMGTGSGIQAIAAAKNKKVRSIIAVDINKEAVIIALHDAMKRGIPLSVQQSNLFDNIDEKFDTIIFNPPYLPTQKPKDLALDGGKKGYELIQKFLKQAKKHLEENGTILLLFSSLTDKSKVDEILTKNKYKFKEVDKLKLDFEELYIYKIKCK
jgi:release factor glutamine methyltransferase